MAWGRRRVEKDRDRGSGLEERVLRGLAEASQEVWGGGPGRLQEADWVDGGAVTEIGWLLGGPARVEKSVFTEQGR